MWDLFCPNGLFSRWDFVLVEFVHLGICPLGKCPTTVQVHEFTEKLSPCRDKDRRREEEQAREERREEREKRREVEEEEMREEGFQFMVPPTPGCFTVI